jgi:hypothetical protein
MIVRVGRRVGKQTWPGALYLFGLDARTGRINYAAIRSATATSARLKRRAAVCGSGANVSETIAKQAPYAIGCQHGAEELQRDLGGR